MHRSSVLLLIFAWLLISSVSFAATDGAYTLSEVSGIWDGTIANTSTLVSADYTYGYGDDTTFSYTLPWNFYFYGHGYNKITIDTNGAIWFDSTTSVHEFNLAKSNRGLVVAPWNYDLSSAYEGGVFVQHKTGPERIVIEWRTETYSDEGSGLLNVFEAVLFADSTIRFDYQSFSTVNPGDAGSGISKDDDTHVLSTTTTYGNSYVLAGRSFNFVPFGPGTSATLTVEIAGSGSGWITSNPAGVVCNTTCYTDFPLGTQVTLHPVASPYSYFTGWSGSGCSGMGDCNVTMSENALVTAGFTYDDAHQIRIEGGVTGYYTNLQAAYNAADDGSIIKMWATKYTESLICARPVTVSLSGGYDEAYATRSGETLLKGTLTVTDGTVIIDGLTIQ